MAIITKTIGSAGGRDYSTIQAWEDALPANAVTAGNSYVGSCYADSEFVVAGTVVTFSGTVTDATHTITLTAAAGQSFADNANKLTNKLYYNAVNGVALRNSLSGIQAVYINESYVTLSRLQIKTVDTWALVCNVAAPTMVDQCIFVANSGSVVLVLNGSAPALYATNCLFVSENLGANYIIDLGKYTNEGGVFANCTLVATANHSAGGSGFLLPNVVTTVVNCAVFGVTSVGSISYITPVTCGTDVVSPPAGWTGSLTYANQFENTGATLANADFRLKTGANLINVGTTDTTDIPAAVDIVGTHRPQGAAWDIGAWEWAAAVSFIPRLIRWGA